MGIGFDRLMSNSTPTPNQNEQKEAPPARPDPAPASALATGQRAAFRDLKLQLTDDDLTSLGTQKCILDMLNRAEGECNDLKEYRLKYHAADKQGGILEEKLKSNKINEVMFGVGVGVGCTIMGLTPFFWELKTLYGIITLGVGVVLTGGATLGRILFK
jgi:hypothetical protein